MEEEAKQKKEDKPKKIKTTGSFIEKQKSTYELFEPNKTPEQTKQYAWEQYTGQEYNPPTPYTTKTPCYGVDNATKELLKKYLNGQQLTNEKHKSIDKSLAPKALMDLIDGNGKDGTNNTPSETIQKIM